MSVGTLDFTVILGVARAPFLPFRMAELLFASPEPEEFLKQHFRDNEHLRCALFLASPSLYRAMEEWLGGKTPQNPRFLIRLASYLLRMSSRPTPFGLFAGLGLIECGGVARTLRFASAHSHRIAVRPDIVCLDALLAEVESDPEVFEALLVVANDQMLARGDRLFFPHPDRYSYRESSPQDQAPAYDRISTSNNAAIRYTLQRAATPKTVGDIADGLESHFKIPRDEATLFIRQLREGGLLMAASRPRLVDEAVEALLAQAERLRPDLAQHTERIRASTAAVSSTLPGLTLQQLAGARNAARLPMIEDRLRLNDGIQLDLLWKFEGGIGETVVQDIARLAEWTLRCSHNAVMRTYRRKFLERYGSESRTVPLLELLDDDFGLGSPEWPEKDRPDDPGGERERALLHLATDAIREGRLEVVISRQDMDLYSVAVPESAPDTMEVGVKIAATSCEAMNAGDYQIALAPIYATACAGRSIGRFAPDLPSSAAVALRNAINSDDDVVEAELVYFPTSRKLANVALRPHLTKHEIQVGVFDGRGVERIPVDDIVVGLLGDEFVLWSKSLQKRVVVRESHAMNTNAAETGVTRFLSQVRQQQTRQPDVLYWGRAAEQLPFRPRLRCGRIILSLAVWRVPLKTAQADDQELEDWLNRWKVPNFVYLTEEDNRLLIAPRAALGRSMLRDAASRGKGAIVLEEAFPGPNMHWLTSERGAHDCEIVVSLKNGVTASPKADWGATVPIASDDERFFVPGSEWTYVKLYCGYNQMDTLIRDGVGPLVSRLNEHAKISRWFFLRYDDGRSHVRLRIHGESPEQILEAVVEQCKAMQASGLIYEFALDTYSRELERYGGNALIASAEALFSYDSDNHVTYLRHRPRDLDERMVRALESFAPLFGRLLDDGDRRLWQVLHRPNERMSAQDRAFVRLARGRVREALASDIPDHAEAPIARYRAARLRGALSADFLSIVSSILHMSFNRAGVDPNAERVARLRFWHILSSLQHMAETSAVALGAEH